MISLSHWGMFAVEPRVVFSLVGYKPDPRDIAEWEKSGGIIRLVMA